MARIPLIPKFREIYFSYLYFFLKRTFPFWQKLGFHITPVHFYEPVPDTRTLPDTLWDTPPGMGGVDMNESGQIRILEKFSGFREEYSRIPDKPTLVPHQFYIGNGAIGPVDFEVLYCMARLMRPRRVVEIGSGNTTYLLAQALLKNQSEDAGNDSELIAIEPYPNPVLQAGFPGLTRLIVKKVEVVPLSEFTGLRENDILFIDSSHVLKAGSDVQYELFEILPLLHKGVIVHFHDIFLPAEYPRNWLMKERRFWNEQYALRAFLMFNNSFEVLWGGGHMHLNHADRLQATFPSYCKSKNWPGSFWMKKIK